MFERHGSVSELCLANFKWVISMDRYLDGSSLIKRYGLTWTFLPIRGKLGKWALGGRVDGQPNHFWKIGMAQCTQWMVVEWEDLRLVVISEFSLHFVLVIWAKHRNEQHLAHLCMSITSSISNIFHEHFFIIDLSLHTKEWICDTKGIFGSYLRWQSANVKHTVAISMDTNKQSCCTRILCLCLGLGLRFFLFYG